jgi:hypothetical protein
MGENDTVVNIGPKEQRYQHRLQMALLGGSTGVIRDTIAGVVSGDIHGSCQLW